MAFPHLHGTRVRAQNLKTMKYLPALFLFLALTACQDDDDGRMALEDVELTMDFRAEYGDQPLDIQQAVYSYPTGEDTRISLFQYFVSDLELLPADGSEPVKLADIDVMKWENPGDAPVITRTYTVPAGEYTGMRFGLGVSPDLNAQDPSNFAVDFVLNENEFWGPQTRYVFAKIEGRADLDDDGTFDAGVSVHMGADSLYTVVNFLQPFTLDGDGNNRLTLTADVLEAFAANGRVYDIGVPENRTVHGGNQALASGVWRRLADQFTLTVE